MPKIDFFLQFIYLKLCDKIFSENKTSENPKYSNDEKKIKNISSFPNTKFIGQNLKYSNQKSKKIRFLKNNYG